MNRRLLSASLCWLLLTGTAVVFAQQGGGCVPHDPPGTGLGLGENRAIELNGQSLVDEILVTVRTDFLRPWVVEQIALDITITSVDGIDHFHGTDVIPLSETEIFSITGELADVVVTWTADNESMVINDLYTVCSQLVELPFSTPIGPQRCSDYGPF